MQPSDHEDYLELILENRIESLEEDTLQLISQKCEKNIDVVLADFRLLEESGDIILGPGTAVRLTEQGQRTAECVLKKHKTLECFFTEMLGMDPDTASQQACRMEHEATDDTISRLNQYLSRPRRCRQERHRPCAQICEDLKPISSYQEKETVRVALIRGPRRLGRLNDIGVIPGEEITIQRKLANGSLVVTIKGSDVAISPEIAASVLVEPVE
ncbi:metal-dependent transcriptional regulator [Methanogenium organophilum]|uniref:Metal-dependent transcriptional regulator n=1 Tax=Methanogenium organophilum TaxID=2199 RepID=A0A9X9S3Z4_METOG|nr:metal-dependent transcriptional regulator [Methanogenium organophilum]WAI01063.1 metal-dependent transcriptional regulator [Methanogenium organophilum]